MKIDNVCLHFFCGICQRGSTRIDLVMDFSPLQNTVFDTFSLEALL